MNGTILNEKTIQNEINLIINNDPNLDFISKIKKFEILLSFIYNNRKNQKKNIKINIKKQKKETKTKTTDIFYEILKNEKIQNFIFEYGSHNDLKKAKTYGDLEAIYTYSLKFVKILDRMGKKDQKINPEITSGFNSSVFANAISIGGIASASERVMSRCNDYGGLKSMDYPFNPF